MKKLLFLLTLGLFLTVSARAQVGQPDCLVTLTLSNAGRQVFDNRGLSQPVCTTWHLTYFNEGFSALSIELDEAPSSNGAPGTWVTWPTPASGSQPLTATTQGQLTLFKYFPWVSINITSVTGTGTIRAAAYGYRPNFSGDTNASSTAVTTNTSTVDNAPVSGGPVFIGTTNGGNLIGLSSAAGNGDANAGARMLSVALSYFNGASWDRAIYCPNTSTFSVVSAITQIIPLSGSTKIRICSFGLHPSTVTAGSTDIIYGTGASCGTGTTTLTGAFTLPAAAVVDIATAGLTTGGPLTTPAGQAVCVRSVTSTINGFITWEQH